MKQLLNKVTQGDCLEVMKQIPDKSVDLTVTSPPYDNLRDYKGYSFNFKGIAKQLLRVTKDGGVIVWIVGDATIDGGETGTSFNQALHFKEIGFNLYDTMIYEKYSKPLTHKRYEQRFEYMFVFTKGKLEKFNGIRDVKNRYFGDRISSTTRERDGKTYDCSGKKKGSTISKFGLRGNIWRYATGHNKSTNDLFSFKHPAIFPEKLAKDHIISWSNKGDLVLDPMCGSGTTLKVAKELGRNFIGIEISPEYCKIANQRLQQEILLT